MTEKKDILAGLTTIGIKDIVTSSTGQPGYRGAQVAEWLYRKPLARIPEFLNMTDLPVSLRTALDEKFSLLALTEATLQEDLHDGTVKVVAALYDGPHIECVLMPDERRVSVCLSTQAGCPMACAFCATGTQGLARNLTASEIVSQLLLLQRRCDRRITHAVFMGMGEPMLNLENVVLAIRIMHDEIGMSMRHITVSTVGILPGIERLAAEHMPVTLAVSLHAPTDELRASIVPVHRTYSLAQLLNVCRGYFDTTGRQVTFEYILLREVNDRPDDAMALVRLLTKFPAAINLIPYNATSVAGNFQRPENERIRQFRQILEDGGLVVTQRKERGRRISAACGQLVTEQFKSSVTTGPPVALVPAGCEDEG
jgi:23S rRNA (adenine2503-C2)-methyltransferase